MNIENKNKNFPNVLEHQSYRQFISAVLQYFAEAKQSARGVNKKLAMPSPNFLQQVAAGKRDLSGEMAGRIADKLGFDPIRKKYFSLLCDLEKQEDTKIKIEILDKMQQCIRRAERKSLVDPSLSSDWLNEVLMECANIPDLDMSADSIATKLRGHASAEDVARSLDFLVKKGWLIPCSGTSNKYRAAAIDVQAINTGRKSLDGLQCHLRFLEMSKHRLWDDYQDRSFQSLTIAVPKGKIEFIRQRLSKFLDEINEELSGAPNCAEVVHLQCKAFKVFA